MKKIFDSPWVKCDVIVTPGVCVCVFLWRHTEDSVHNMDLCRLLDLKPELPAAPTAAALDADLIRSVSVRDHNREDILEVFFVKIKICIFWKHNEIRSLHKAVASSNLRRQFK